MASTVLHIKDSYYFDVPKSLWPSRRAGREDFPAFWVRLDSHYQLWEARRLARVLAEMPDAAGTRTEEQLVANYLAWKEHDHRNFGKPLVRYLQQAPETKWFRAKIDDPEWVGEHSGWVGRWNEARQAATVRAYRSETPASAWSPEKIEGYNQALSGKILIPQPPTGRLRNLYQAESGFCVSKFMILELVVALVLAVVFIWLGARVRTGRRPRGRLWNFLEAILLFLRDEVARPAIGAHEADRFMPLLWTMFLFILGCNLMGMVPWAGAPTAAWGATFAMAVVTLATTFSMGIAKLGPIGFWSNMIPKMDLPLFLKPLGWTIQVVVLVIEVGGTLIRHGVLSVRLLANMVAGHLVLLGIMMAAVKAAPSASWPVAAAISVVGSTLFSCLELFVAFLQAYVFVFLSALFIGAAIHRH